MKVVKITKDSIKDILNDLLKRSPNHYDSYADKVQAILNDIKENKD